MIKTGVYSAMKLKCYMWAVLFVSEGEFAPIIDS